MDFEFIPSKGITSAYEYLTYVYEKGLGFKLLKLLIKIPYLIVLLFICIFILTMSYNSFFTNILIAYIGVLICTLIFSLFVKNFIKKDMTLHINKNCDDVKIKSTFKVENNYLIRENDLGKIKILINNISNIYLMKNTLIILIILKSLKIL